MPRRLVGRVAGAWHSPDIHVVEGDSRARMGSFGVLCKGPPSQQESQSSGDLERTEAAAEVWVCP